MSDRLENWKRKSDGEMRKRLYDLQKEKMCKLETIATESLVRIENQVKHIVEGAPILHIPYYMIFAKEIFRLQKSHEAQTLINEAEILEEKWRARGLDYTFLQKIKEFYIESYPRLQHFKCDISLLDGPHLLA